MIELYYGLIGSIWLLIPFVVAAYQDFKYRKVNKFLLALIAFEATYFLTYISEAAMGIWFFIASIITLVAMIKGDVKIPPADIIMFYTSPYFSLVGGIIALIYSKLTNEPAPFIGITSLLWSMLLGYITMVYVEALFFV